ncbi:hypothetical protein VIGAN_01229300 [Vigna angularis var. angularis]|uniref:DUF569 domain-containing protein n=1 Tax=Vigna angularis var. angularis TaxID=157739 RepID=A0A0S3R222_PHAAN|nr:uncharacterized protein LOC108321457 [Vigna angularis]BAT74590.1 hypothetical protein VIGAN_01229300 [Vigna angularis var. angularis]
MEHFNKAKAVKLRSHLGKYLVADDDHHKIRQSKNGSTRKAIWLVEHVKGKSHHVRLRNSNGRYLTATDAPFLLGVTGNKVVQGSLEEGWDGKLEWEPITEGFHVRLRSWCGRYLRGNGGTLPWRNSITHDDPYSSVTHDWILWGVEPLEFPDKLLSSPETHFSSEEPGSPTSLSSLSRSTSSDTVFRSGMEFFHRAKVVRLRSHHDKYLLADDDEESVTQDRNGSSRNSKWTVELIPEFDNLLRLKSCYGKYLTASNQPLLLGVTGRKVVQSMPRRLDSSVEWEPVREGAQVKLKTRYGNYLRANGGLPPWRNSVTHDIPHRTATQDWILWDVDVLEIHVVSPAPPPIPHSDSLDFDSSTPSAVSIKSTTFSRQESTDSYVGSPPKSEGRTIYYHVAEDNGDVDDENVQGYSLAFKGNGVEQLTRKFEEETGLEGVIVCTRSPLNGKLYPLRLQLPPNNVTMQVVLVLPSSKVAKDFEEQGLL